LVKTGKTLPLIGFTGNDANSLEFN
jgi:hypothetical protein